MNPKDKNSYMGRSAQLSVMSKLADLGYQVSVPEVDVGRDVLIFLNTGDAVTAVQVKSTDCRRLTEPAAYHGTIDVPLSQLVSGGELYYVFVFGFAGEWLDHLVISREQLHELQASEGIGSEYVKGKKVHLKFRFTFRSAGTKAGVRCGQVVFDGFRNAWGNLATPPGGDEPRPVLAGQPVHTAAQTAVKSRLLGMGCNVALVEIGRLLAFPDEQAGYTHIRVRAGTAVAAGQTGDYAAEVAVPLQELKEPSPLFYVFPVCWQGRYADFMVISRSRLDELRLNNELGPEEWAADTGVPSLKLKFCFSPGAVVCGGVDLTAYRNAWRTLYLAALTWRAWGSGPQTGSRPGGTNSSFATGS